MVIAGTYAVVTWQQRLASFQYWFVDLTVVPVFGKRFGISLVFSSIIGAAILGPLPTCIQRRYGCFLPNFLAVPPMGWFEFLCFLPGKNRRFRYTAKGGLCEHLLCRFVLGISTGVVSQQNRLVDIEMEEKVGGNQ